MYTSSTIGNSTDSSRPVEHTTEEYAGIIRQEGVRIREAEAVYYEFIRCFQPSARSLTPSARSLTPSDRSLTPSDRSLTPSARSLTPSARSLTLSPSVGRFRRSTAPSPSRSPDPPEPPVLLQEAEALQEIGRLMLRRYRRSMETVSPERTSTPSAQVAPVTAPNAPIRQQGRRNILVSPSIMHMNYSEISSVSSNIPILDHQKIDDTETDIAELQCPVCMSNQKVIANRCGHQLCCGCSYEVTCRDSRCPECRHPWKDLLRLF
jgi:hypothetical protein